MRRKRGFAVVLAVALLAAIVLLLLALTMLTRSELRAAAQRGAAEQARHNARVGLQVALGRLQAAAGPDARSTATAQALGAVNPFWSGVWTDSGAPVWLVSGTPGDAGRTIVTDGAAADGAVLVGARTTSAPDGVVRAPFENLTRPAGTAGGTEMVMGRFAYWIGDEGVKGNVGVIDRVDAVPVPVWPAADDPVASTAERARLRQLVAHRAGNDALNYGEPPTSGFLLGAESDTAAAVRWAQFGAALAPSQLRFQELGTAQATENYRVFLRRHYHDFTISSLGVLADAAAGGLRRNYSDLAAAEVPAAVKDLERYRPAGGRLALSAGTAPAGEASAQIKPVITEWALDFVPFRESGSGRLLIGCRLRVELWNPYNLPLVLAPGGVAALRFRLGGSRVAGAGAAGNGLPVVRVSGPAGVVGEVDLCALLPPDREIVPLLPETLGARQIAVVEALVANAWDSGLAVEDPTPGDATDDHLRCETADSGTRILRLDLCTAAGSGAIFTTLAGFPSASFTRVTVGDWTAAGGQPFASAGSAAAPLARLGVSYHFRLDPARAHWSDWLDTPDAPDLRAPRIEYAAPWWRSAATDPATNAVAAAAQFAGGELFAAGEAFAAADFTVQRNLSLASLGQLAVPGERAFGIGQPWGGARNAVFDAGYFNPVPASWQPGERLPNVRHRVLDSVASPPPTAAALAAVDAARYLGVEGMFNVNSVSPEAWTVLLGRAVLGWTDSTGATHDLENPFFVFGQSAPFAPTSARGVRQFSDTAIQALAAAVVARIEARPRPFRSLAEFVNSGVLQEAIDAAGLNTRAEFCADLGQIPPERRSANFLSQAALLNTLASLLAVRSDTFTIRVAAEALNPALAADDPDRVAARAWCEAVVQRMPDYVDATENAAVWPPTLAENATLGRRFRIVSFRWLGPDDL